LKLCLNNNTANINGKNWPVYNQVQGDRIIADSSEMANISLVELHLEIVSTHLPAVMWQITI